MKKGTRNIILVTAGVLAAGSLAFASRTMSAKQPGIQYSHDIIESKKTSINKGSDDLNEYVNGFASEALEFTSLQEWAADRKKQTGEVTLPELKDDKKTNDDKQDEPEDVVEETTTTEESNVATKKETSVASTIIGIIATVSTLGLAGFIFFAFSRKKKKAQAE